MFEMTRETVHPTNQDLHPVPYNEGSRRKGLAIRPTRPIVGKQGRVEADTRAAEEDAAPWKRTRPYNLPSTAPWKRTQP